jgi:hypothetical protein
MNLRPHPEERALARVSKDGRESVRCVHPSRRLLRKLLRMRTVFFAGSKMGHPVSSSADNESKSRGVLDRPVKPDDDGSQ